MHARRRRRRPATASRRFGLWTVLAALALALLALGYLLAGARDTQPAGDVAAGLERAAQPAPVVARSEAAASAPTDASPGGSPPPSERYPQTELTAFGDAVEPLGPPPPGGGVRLALVIDDLGRSLEDLDALDALGVPVTYAVLPFESRTSEVVSELNRRGHELIVHLPMEPSSGADPGPGALRGFMSRSQLERATREALAQVPGAIGANNHMGSSLTADGAKMRAVLGVLAERDLFFLDSRTSADSVGYRQAVALGLPAAERQVFLDSDPDRGAIRAQFRRWLELAARRGAAIAIGHPHPSTMAVLAEEVPRARAAGYEFVPVSYLLDYAGDLEP